ncbi:Rtn1p ASCRUDRAFT_6412 [Ascoidea rubescens DSM 1968]|uniref:Reticulon-like protein n=1 Tax=Ascoidea rubescens DSM 1968 TaxID=1344418 RepID=A0A1D2VMB5_9ASCO|nr:hypothetical protein ASCRUDRAFT_6412 [Ascoidea rubescens DSM 1968]ODV62750.1 hypothetical protein ASCRUDRAFT_6412 [Ascoidea rubescens DSM 1968]
MSVPQVKIPSAPASSTGDGCPSKILKWENPQKTGKIFGLTIFSLLAVKYLNLLNIFFHFAFISLFVSAAAEYLGKLITGTGFVTHFRPAYSNKFTNISSKVLPHVTLLINLIESESQKLFYSADVEKTLKAAGVSYLLYKITSWFSLYTLVFTSVIGAFSVPAIYSRYQNEIDQGIVQYTKIAKQRAIDLQTAASTKSKPLLAKATQSFAPLTGFLNKNLPTRTAGSTVKSPVNPASFPAAPKVSPDQKPLPVERHEETAPLLSNPAPAPAF